MRPTYARSRRRITPATRLVFVETIANPRTQVADLERIGEVCKARGLIYVVDNTMTSPYLFLPSAVGASLVVNALTKYIGGHGNALGGAITDTGRFDWTRYPNIYDSYKGPKPGLWGITQIRKKGLRDWGGTLAAEQAHHIAVGAETLALRMDRACANALELARFLEVHPQVRAVYYPGLASHPQHALATELFRCLRRIAVLRARPGAGLLRLPQSPQERRPIVEPRRQPDAGDPGGAYDFPRDGCATPRQHGDRRFADPHLGRDRGSRRSRSRTSRKP